MALTAATCISAGCCGASSALQRLPGRRVVGMAEQPDRRQPLIRRRPSSSSASADDRAQDRRPPVALADRACGDSPDSSVMNARRGLPCDGAPGAAAPARSPRSAAGCQPNSPSGSAICDDQLEASLGGSRRRRTADRDPASLPPSRRAMTPGDATNARRNSLGALAHGAEDRGAHPRLRPRHAAPARRGRQSPADRSVSPSASATRRRTRSSASSTRRKHARQRDPRGSRCACSARRTAFSRTPAC